MSKPLNEKHVEAKPAKGKEPAEPICRPASLTSREFNTNFKIHIFTSCN